MSADKRTPQQAQAQVDALAAASKRYHVPLYILAGVWLKETGSGANVHTSSAGAIGDFQFLPSTAAHYQYPLTNTPTPTQFAAQANAAARYLADLHHQHGGDWDAALRAYSGGGYDTKTDPKAFGNTGGFDPLTSTYDAGKDVVTGALKWTEALAKALGYLMQPKTWLRALELIAGLVLGFFALKQLAAVGAGSAHKPVTRTRTVIV